MDKSDNLEEAKKKDRMLCRKQTLIVLSIHPTSKDFVTSQVHAVFQG